MWSGFGKINNPYPAVIVWWSAINLLWAKRKVAKSFLPAYGQCSCPCSKAAHFEFCFFSWGVPMDCSWQLGHFQLAQKIGAAGGPGKGWDNCVELGTLICLGCSSTIHSLEWALLPSEGIEEVWKHCRLQTQHCCCSWLFWSWITFKIFFLLVVVVWSGKLSIKAKILF